MLLFFVVVVVVLGAAASKSPRSRSRLWAVCSVHPLFSAHLVLRPTSCPVFAALLFFCFLPSSNLHDTPFRFALLKSLSYFINLFIFLSPTYYLHGGTGGFDTTEGSPAPPSERAAARWTEFRRGKTAPPIP